MDRLGAMSLRSYRFWLTTPAARPERAAALLLLLAVAVLAWKGLELPTLVLGLLAVTIMVAGAVLARRVVQWLLGPMFFYEVLTSGRRGRNISLRCLYAVALLGAVFYTYSSWFGSGSFGRPLSPGALARFATQFFYAFLGTQFLAVLVLTPIFTAGAIADERERRRMDFLLATDLRDRELVCGKLAARLAAVALLLLTGLPILALMQFLGGVEPHLLLAGFLITLITMISVGALSIFVSALCEKSSNALALTYLLMLGFLGACWCPPLLNIGHPGVLYHAMDHALGSESSVELLAECVGAYTAYHLLFSTVAAVAAAWNVRPAIDHAQLRRNPPREVTVGPLPKPPPPPPFDPFTDRRPPPPVDDDRPLLWKELYIAQERSNPALRTTLLAAGVLVGGMIGVQLLAVVLGEAIHRRPIGHVVNPIVRGISAAVGCFLSVGIVLQAVGSVVREREHQTLDSLLTLPVERSDILWAKWLGSILHMRALFVLLGCVWIIGVLTGGLHPLAVPLLVAAVAAFAAFAAGLGLVCSVLSATKVQALMRAAVTLFLLMMLTVLIDNRLNLAQTAPPAVLWNLAFHPRNSFSFSRYEMYYSGPSFPHTHWADFQLALAGIGFYGLLAPFLWFWSRDVFLKEGQHERA